MRVSTVPSVYCATSAIQESIATQKNPQSHWMHAFVGNQSCPFKIEKATIQRGWQVLPRDIQLSNTEGRLRPEYLRLLPGKYGVDTVPADKGQLEGKAAILPDLVEQVPRATDTHQGFLKASVLRNKPPKPSSFKTLHTWTPVCDQVIPWGFLLFPSFVSLTETVGPSDSKAIRNRLKQPSSIRTDGQVSSPLSEPQLPFRDHLSGASSFTRHFTCISCVKQPYKKGIIFTVAQTENRGSVRLRNLLLIK